MDGQSQTCVSRAAQTIIPKWNALIIPKWNALPVFILEIAASMLQTTQARVESMLVARFRNIMKQFGNCTYSSTSSTVILC
jgi:hypothetical protein